MKILRCLVVAVVMSVPMWAQQSIDFGSQVPSDGTYSTSDSWDTTGGFIFEVGSFASDFTPTTLNFSEWASNWVVANQGASGTTTWIDDDGDTGFIGNGLIVTLSEPFTSGANVYIWGFDSKAAGSREWVLLTDPAWLVASDISSPVTSSFIVEGSTTAVVGSVTNGGASLQSALVNVGAIPEPATLGVIFGVSALGMVACRRRARV